MAPEDPERYPLRDEVIDYLRTYQNRFSFPIKRNTLVKNIEKKKRHFVIQTHDGRLFRARSVISATGAFNFPSIPNNKGQDQFTGTVIHSKEYSNSERFRGQRGMDQWYKGKG